MLPCLVPPLCLRDPYLPPPLPTRERRCRRTAHGTPAQSSRYAAPCIAAGSGSASIKQRSRGFAVDQTFSSPELASQCSSTAASGTPVPSTPHTRRPTGSGGATSSPRTWPVTGATTPPCWRRVGCRFEYGNTRLRLMPPAASSMQFASGRVETAQPVAAPPSVVTPSRLSIVHERGISPTRTSARVELSHLRGCRAEPRGSWHLANHSGYCVATKRSSILRSGTASSSATSAPTRWPSVLVGDAGQ